jgi:hypothetical protein
MKKRPPVIFAPAFKGDPSQVADARFFQANPTIREYERPLIPGESPEPLPPGTTVHVKLVGRCQRVRAFLTPQEGRN